jgi:hypothetical protein
MLYSIESVLFLLGISERKYVWMSLAPPLVRPLAEKNHQYFVFVCRCSSQPGTRAVGRTRYVNASHLGRTASLHYCTCQSLRPCHNGKVLDLTYLAPSTWSGLSLRIFAPIWILVCRSLLWTKLLLPPDTVRTSSEHSRERNSPP